MSSYNKAVMQRRSPDTNLNLQNYWNNFKEIIPRYRLYLKIEWALNGPHLLRYRRKFISSVQ
jgi:hypothetical protein